MKPVRASGPVVPCRHLAASTDAHVYETGERVTVHLCTWGSAERRPAMPPWLSEWSLAGGPNFRPERDCPACAVHEPYDFASNINHSLETSND